eukprot:1562382-Prymnesium_polylepis.1
MLHFIKRFKIGSVVAVRKLRQSECDLTPRGRAYRSLLPLDRASSRLTPRLSRAPDPGRGSPYAVAHAASTGIANGPCFGWTMVNESVTAPPAPREVPAMVSGRGPRGAAHECATE